MMRGKDKGKPYDRDLRGYQATPLDKGTTGVLQLPRRGERPTPSPICTLNTHTKKLPLAFTKENWLKECLNLNPNRDLRDIYHTFEKARDEKGASDSDWMRWAKHYDRYYEPITKAPIAPTSASTPRSWQKQPSKPQEPSCYSPRLKPLDHTDPKILEDSLYDALKNRDSIACIVAGLDPAMVASSKERAEARLKPKTS